MTDHYGFLRAASALTFLWLGACGTSSAPVAGSTASGEILPGSVSDAMLETDRSQAEPPLAPSAPRAVAKADASGDAEMAASPTVTILEGPATADEQTPAKPAAVAP